MMNLNGKTRRLTCSHHASIVSFLLRIAKGDKNMRPCDMRRSSKSHYVNGLIATCDCRKKVG